MNNIKEERVTDLSIIMEMIDSKPYYSVKYRNIGENGYNIGYSSYNLKTVLEFIGEYFEIVENDKQTNADRIRNMSDEEMANYFHLRGVCRFCAYYGQSMICLNADDSCGKGIKKWLQSEAE